MSGVSDLLSKYGTSLSETRKLFGEMMPAVQKEKKYPLLETPQFFTAQDVKGLGLTTGTGEAFELKEGWMLKLTPNGAEPTISLKSPTGEEVGLEDVLVTPEGEWVTRAQQEVQLTEWQDTIGTLSSKLFPEYEQIDFTGVLEYAQENPEDFMARIQKIGRTSETEALLKMMGATEQDITDLLPLSSTGIALKPLTQMPLGSYVLSAQPNEAISAFAKSDFDGLRQAMLFEGRNEKTEALLRDSGWTEKAINDFFLDNAPGKFVKGEWLPDALEDYWKLYWGGTGDMVGALAGAADRLGADGVADAMKQIGLEGRLITIDVEMGKPDSPEWYAKNITRMLPMMLAIIDAGWATGGGGSALVTAAGGGSFLSAIVGTITAGAVTTIGEGTMEAGDAYLEAERRGFTEAERNDVFDEVLRGNAGLLSITNTAQFGAGFFIPGGRTATFLVKALIFGFEASSEGLEEGVQLAITREALGDVQAMDEEMWQNVKLGLAGGLGFGAVATIYQSIGGNVQAKMTDEQKNLIRQWTGEFMAQGLSKVEADSKAWDRFAETKEGAQVVTEAVQDMMSGEQEASKAKFTEIKEKMAEISEKAKEKGVIKETSQRANDLAWEMVSREWGIEVPEAEVEGLKTLENDPVAKARFKLGGKNVDLTAFISIREQSFPEYFSVKQAEALFPGHNFSYYTQKGTPQYNHVPKDVALDDLTKKFSMSPDEIAERVMAIREERNKIKRLETERAVAEKEPKKHTIDERIQRVREQYRKKEETVAQLRQTLYDIAKDAPVSVRAKMLAAMKNVKTDAQLDKAIERIGRLDEEYRQRTLSSKIRSELQNIKPKKKRGILTGRFTAQVQEKLETIKHNLDADRDEARDKIASNLEAYESGKIGYEEMLEANEILNLAGIKGMNSQELQTVLDNVQMLKSVGRTLMGDKWLRERARIDTIREDISDVVTGGKGLKPGIGTVPSSELEVTKTWLEKLVNAQFSWDNLLDKLSKFHKSKPYHSPLSVFGNIVHQARNTEKTGVESSFGEIMENFGMIFNVKRRSRMNQLLNRMASVKVDLGMFTNLDGVEVHLQLTKDQIMKKYMELQDPTLAGTFYEGMRWTSFMEKAINDNLTAQEKAWAGYQMQFYQDYYASINKIYSEIYGVNLPHNNFYSPISRDLEAEIPENVLTYRDLSHFASVLNGSLKSRVRNKVPLKFNGSTEVLINHVQQMEHFKAWATTMRDLRRVFGSVEVRTAIRQYHGMPILKKIDQYLNDLARNGIEKAKINHVADFLRKNFTLSILGIKPAIALKQTPSVLVYSTEMPIADFVVGIADFWTNPVGHHRFLMKESAFYRERFGKEFAMERDMKFAAKQHGANLLSGKSSVRSYFMTLIRMGDKFAITQGMWAKYKSALKQGKGKVSQAEAIAEAEQVSQRTQPTSRMESLSSWQNGGSWMKLLTMFQNQPNKYFRIMADNARNFKYGRGNRAKAASNIFLVWVVMPALFQFIADAFQFKKEHQIKAWVLGPINWLLIIGGIAQSAYGWITNEPFDYQASPVLQTFEEIRKTFLKAKQMVEDGQDPYQDISMDDLIAAVEYFAKAAGQLTGLPTPYLVQAEKAIRAGEPWELIFSRWSLQKPDKDNFTKAGELENNLGRGKLDIDLTSDDPETRRKAEDEQETREDALEQGLTVEPPEMYDMGDWYTDMRRIFDGNLPSDVLSDGKSTPLIKAWATIEQYRADADILPDTQLYKINTDTENEDTIVQYYKQWQARQQIDNLSDLQEFDQLYPKANLGNVTRQQYELLVQYLNADDQDAFLEGHPELKANPRDEWLKSHPEANAYLSIIGQAKVLSMEAYNTAKKLITDLDIPDSALPEFTLPPEGSVENYFKYNESGQEYGYNSAEVKLLLLEDDTLREWLSREPVDTPVESLEISVKWRDMDELYAGYSDKESLNYIKDDDERVAAREKLLADNLEYADDRRRRDAYSAGLSENQIDTYVEWYQTSRKGYLDDWFLMDNQDFYNEMVKLDQLEERDFTKVPDVKWRSLWEDWVEQDAKYEGVSDRDSEYYISDQDERAKYRAELLETNTQYRQDRRKREALEYGLSEDLLDAYVGWYEITKPEDYEYSLWYEDDWYLIDHPDFNQAMLDLGIWTEPRDLSKVPSRKVFELYKTYQGLPSGNPRTDFRAQHPELDAWLVLKFGYKPVEGRGDTEAPKTKWEEAEEARRIKEWIEGL